MKRLTISLSYFHAVYIALLLLLSTTSFAQVKTWTNIGGDNLWNNPNNWLPVGTPSGIDNVEFDGTQSNANCIINVDVNVQFFAVLSNYSATITVGSALNLNFSGNFIISGGTFDATLANQMTVNGEFIMDAGNFISTNNTLAIGGSIDQTASTFDNNGGVVRMFNPGTNIVNVSSPLFDFVQDSGVNIDLINDLTINGYAEFNSVVSTLSTPTLFLNGNVNFNTGANVRVSVYFGGTSDQVIDGTDAVIDGLNTAGIEINKPSGDITLNKPLVLDALNVTLRMVAGNIISTSTNYLQMGNAGGSAYSFQDFSANSFIDGILYAHTIFNGMIQADYLFPIGKNGRYAPMQVQNYSDGGAGILIKAEYFDTSFNEDFNTSSSNPLTKISRKEYWTFDYGSSIGKASIRLFWNSGTFSEITDLSNLTVANRVFQTFTGLPVSWQRFDGTTAGTVSAGSILTSATDLNLGEAKAFTFGSNSPTQSINPLGILPGDGCFNPIALSIGNTNLAYNIRAEAGASGTDIITGDCTGKGATPAVESARWGTFTGNGSRVAITHQKQPGNSNIMLKVYTTSDCVNFTEVDCDYAFDVNDLTTSINLLTSAGQTYYIRAATTIGAETYPVFGDISIITPQITLTAEPAVPAGNLFSGTSQNVVYAVKLDNPNADDILNQVSFTTGGTYTAGEIASFQFYYSLNNVFDVEDIFLGSSSSTGAGETITTSTFATIPTGTSYVFLLASMESSVTDGNTLIINGVNASNFQFNNSTPVGVFPLPNGGTKTLRLLTDNYCLGANEIPVQSGSCNLPITIPASYTNEGPALTGACAGLTVFKDVWIRVNNVNGLGLSVEYTSTNQNAAIAIYEGSCGNLVQIACVNDLAGTGTETIDFFPNMNGDYFIRIMNVESNSELLGSFCIRLQSQAPAGDLCKNGTNLTVGSAAAPFNLTSSFRNVESFAVAACTNESATLDGWRNFTATSTATSVSYQNTNKNSAITVYAGTCGNLTEVACIDDVPANGTETLNFASAIGTTYYVRILNVLDNNAMNGNIRVFNTIPTAPVNLTTSNLSTTSFDLSWDASPLAQSYLVDVATTATFTAGTFVPGYQGINNATTTIAVTGLQSGTTYYCRVRASNGGGTSPNSTTLTVITVLDAPTALDATVIEQTKFTANWTDVLGADSYRLDISTDNFTTFITGFNNRNTGINSLFTVVGLTANTSYQYRVRASINNIPSSNSNVISVTTLPNPPLATTVTAATNISDTGFTANWNPAATATEYFLDVAVNSSFTNFVGGFQNLNVSNVLTYDVTGLSPNTNYFFRVRAGNPGGVSGNSNFLAAFTTTEAPIALDADPISQTGFTANWQTTTGAINYRLDVSTDDLFGTFVAGYQNKSVSTTNDIISGLTPNFTYFYRVRAENSGGVSANSNVITVTTIPSAPSTPTAQAATGITQSGFTGNWSASPSAIGYRLDVSEASDFSSFVSSYQNADVGNVLSIAITGLNGGTTYYYRVRAENIGGSSANSNEINLITIPPTPVAIAATNVNQVSFEANWQASTGTTEYRLDVSQDNLFGSFLPGYQNKLVSGLTDLVSGLSNNTTYYYRVRAVNTTGTTPNSNTVSVTTQPPVPPAPTALPVLLASITETGFKARWNIVLTATQGYRIDVSEASDFSTFVSGYQDFDAGNNLEADVTGLLGSTTYYFRVRAVNNSGPSLNSNVVSVLTKPAAPLALPASNIVVNGNASGFTANWNADATATQYFLDVATSSAFGVGDFVVGYNNLNVGDVTSYDVTSLNDNTLYYYRLRTVNASGQSAGSNFIEVFIEDSNANIPPLPSGLSAFALSPTKIEVSWTDNSTNDTGFELQRTTNVLLGFTTIAIISVNNNNTPREEIYTDSDGGGGLIPGETYFYRVRALGALGNSQYTLPVRATTISDAPERPDNLDGVSGSATSAYLTWSDNSDDEQGFYLYRALDGNDVALVATIPANQTNYTDIGLTQGTTYFYVLTAFKGSSESETSNLAFVTPAPVPFPASSLTATATGVRSVNLTWQDNSTDETGFAIEMASVYSGGTFLFLTEVGAQEGIGTVNFNIDNTIETLESNEVYAFRVFAFNNFGGSRTTLPDTAQTFIDPTIPRPAKPTGVQAEPVSTIEIRLRWQDVSNNEKVFKIERADSPAGPFVEIARVLAGTTNYSDVGLRAGQTYYYRIIAANGGGNSNPSDVAFAQAVCNVIMVVTTDREANGSIVCDTKEIFLELNTNVTQANVVQWFKNDVAIEDANLNTYIASETGEYYCRIIAGDCDKSSSIISVIINPSFSVAAILDTTDRQNPQVEADIQGANSYQWYYNYEPIPGANADSYPVTQAGVYYVIITDEGCSATSNLVFVTESLITAVEEYDFSHLIRLAPNPAQESTQFKLETPVMGDYQIDLIDFTGKRHSVAAGKKETYLLQNTLNLAKYPAGLYLLEVRCRNYIGRKKMVHY